MEHPLHEIAGEGPALQVSPAPSWGADQWMKKLPVVVEEQPRINTNGHEYRWSSFGVTTSGDEARPGARASRPHKTWHSLGQLLHAARPAAAAGRCFGRAHAVAAGRVAGRVPHRRETERDATGVHAGGTPALPGGASSHPSCSSRGSAPVCRAARITPTFHV